MIEELNKLGGAELIKKLSDTFWLKDTTLFKVITDRGEKVLLTVQCLRKLLAGAPAWYNVIKGRVTKKEAADALLKWEPIPPLPRIGYKRPLD